MKITHMIALHLRAGSVTLAGAENNMILLCKCLHEAGQDVEILFLLSGTGELPEWVVRKLHALDLRFETFPRFHYRDPRAIWRLGRLLRAKRDRILHCHLMPAEIAGVCAARLAGCRSVAVSWQNDNPFWKRLRWRLAVRCVSPFVNHYIAISKAVAQFRQRCANIPDPKVSVIPAAIEGNEQPSGGGWRRRLGIPEGTWVGFVGRLTEQKGVDVLLRAWQQVERREAHATLSIVGDGELRQNLEDLCGSLQLQRVRFHGAVDEANQIFGELDLACVPSRWEGLGRVVLEAMAAGCPIVASEVGGIPEVTGSSGQCALLVTANETEQLAEAILRLAGDAHFRERLAGHGQARIREHFGPERHLYDTLAVYRCTQHLADRGSAR